jgi:hypothetical protein
MYAPRLAPCLRQGLRQIHATARDGVATRFAGEVVGILR